eukprot:8955304-Alexandrium_andersonii.AAC.1
MVGGGATPSLPAAPRVWGPAGPTRQAAGLLAPARRCHLGTRPATAGLDGRGRRATRPPPGGP